MEPIAIALFAIPVIGAIGSLGVRDRAARYVGVSAAFLTAVAAICLSVRPASRSLVFGTMPWLGVEDRGFFGYQLDPLAVVMLLASTVIGLAVAVYSAGYLTVGNRDHPVQSGQARYYFWLMLFVLSMVGIAVSPSLLQLLVFWEMTTLCSWALISFYDDHESLRAGMKALVLTSVGGLFFMGGLVWVLSATDSLSFSAIGEMSPNLRAWAFVFFLIAAWAKSAQIPFHTWLPDAMAAPTPVSAYLHAAAMVKAGVFLVARLLMAGWGVPAWTGLLISIAALVTMFAALYLFFYQDDLKRLLAYSTIAQLGYILLGLGLGALGSSLAFRGAILHILMHACAKSTLFLSAGAVAYATGTRSISKLSGLASLTPVTAFGFFIGAFALTGVPPLACFWSKVYVLLGALQVKGAIGPIALVLVLTESLVTFAWFLWVGQRVFFGKPSQLPRRESHRTSRAQAETVTALDPPASMEWILVALMILCVLAPIAGIPLVQRITW